VAGNDWWLPALDPKLSQGDLIQGIPFCVPCIPLVPLQETTLRGPRIVWESRARMVLTRQREHALATHSGRIGLVISHSCDLDKNKPSPVLMAPVSPLSSLADDMQAKVLAQGSRALLAFPGGGERGVLYADLRAISPIPRDAIKLENRLFSMTDQAIDRLHAQLVAFLLRRELPKG
jgi:hypothetical protein